MTIVEPTSGNTGLGLAIAAILKGYKLICTASSKISTEKIAMLEAHGAQVIVCPVDVDADDPRSYYKVAERIRDEQGAFLPYQYYNQANPEAHYQATGPEIWEQSGGSITHWVAGIGTGGTISGVAKFLKEKNPAIRVVGVDPEGSVYGYYNRHGHLPPADELHLYLIDGIGQSYMPPSCWPEYIDEVIEVDDKTAYRSVYELARTEGIFTGSSGGAAAFAAREVARRSARRRLRGHPLPRLGRALPVQAQRGVDARQGHPRARARASRKTDRPGGTLAATCPASGSDRPRTSQDPGPGASGVGRAPSRSGARRVAAWSPSSWSAATRTRTCRASPRWEAS